MKVLAFLKRSLIKAVAIMVAARIVGITYTGEGLFLATVMVVLLNDFVRPVLVILALPLLIFSLGLFMLVINAVLLYGVGHLLRPDFTVDTFARAFWAALVISIVTLLLNSLTKTGNAQFQIRRGGRKPPAPPSDKGGPVIDV